MVTTSFAKPERCECSKKGTMTYNFPHSTTNVHVSSCHVIYLAFVNSWDTLNITVLLHLCRSPSSVRRAVIQILVHSAIMPYRWAKFFFLGLFRHTMHHAMCKPTRPPGGIVKPLKFLPTNDSRRGSYTSIM